MVFYLQSALILSINCLYKIFVYSVIKHINTTSTHTISRQRIPYIDGPLGEGVLSNIQSTLLCSSYPGK